MKKTLITLLGIVLCGAAVAVEKPAGATMEQYVDALMRRMTLEEKIGQLNLPSAGDITTGQAKSSDIAEKIRRGEVGGLFNIKGVEKIRDVQRIAVEESRLGIPLIFGMDVIHGYETTFPIPLCLGHVARNILDGHIQHRLDGNGVRAADFNVADLDFFF